MSIQCYSDDGFVELLCRFRSDGAILFVNSAYARACGTTPQEMIHRSFWDFILPDDRNKVRAMLAELTPDNPEVRIENRFESVEGVRWTLWTNRGVAFDEAGTLLEATSSGVDITDLKRAEQALRESEDRRRIASEVAKVGTFEWDMRNDVIAWTRELEALYGLAPGEFGGTYEDWRRLVHPDDLPQAEVKLKQAETDGDFSAQWRVIWPDGSIHYLESRARIDFDEDGNAIRMLGANVDVSERVRTEIALRESELRFRTAAEAVSGIIYEYHYDTCRVERSCGLHAVLGFHQDEVPDTLEWWQDRIHPDDLAEQRALAARPLEPREGFAAEYRVQHRDGHWIHVLDQCLLVSGEDGEPLKLIGCAVDITARKEAEEALRMAHTQLEQRVRERTQELQQRAMQLGRLSSQLALTEQRERQRLAQVLHDHLQQILVASKMRLDILARGLEGTVRDSVVEVSDLLDEALKSSRSLTVELAPPILQEGGLAAGLKWLGRWMHEKHGLEVHVEVDEQVPREREDLRVLLFQSVRELLFNVVKHAGVKQARVKHELAGAKRLCITVVDEGAGFSPELGLVQDAGSHGGFGLFSILERLTLMGGEMRVNSAPGAGTQIVLEAPLQTAKGRERQQLPATHKAQQGISAAGNAAERAVAGIRVLLADDHNVMRQGISALLSSESDIVVVGEASNGEQAVELARMLQPDVVLMDFSMPKLNGVEATRRLMAELPQCIVIGLSMYEEHEQAAAMIAAGAMAYHSKSGNMAQLLELVRTLHAGRMDTAGV